MKGELTRGGVAYNLELSPFNLVVEYEDESLEFIFSSQRNKDSFYNKFVENRAKINESLSKRFGFTIENDKLCDIKLYSMTEKRGFLIKGTEDFKCLDTIKLTGVNLIHKN